MGNQAGYLVDLATVQLDESNGVTSSWIQAMTVGDYMHPVHGKISITMDRIRRFADNVKNGARGQELDIDYDHKMVTREAAGWVKNAEARSDGLWLLVEWTKEAAEKIKNKAYRYFSPEFDDEWTHPKTGQKFQDVLFGGGITNRPFLKDILPINLSEAFAPAEQVATQGGQMDPKKLRELLGLAEDATDEQVTTALTEKLTTPPSKQDPAPTPAQLSEELIKKLAEDNPTIKALVDQSVEQTKQLAEMSTKLRLAEVDNQVKTLNETASAASRALPPAVADTLKALLIKAPKALSDEVLEAVTKLAEVGFVELGERGQNRDHDSDGDSAAKRFNDAVAQLQKDDAKLSYADATEMVARTNPQLFSEYQSASYAFTV